MYLLNRFKAPPGINNWPFQGGTTVVVHTYLGYSNYEFHVAWLCGHPSIIWLFT